MLNDPFHRYVTKPVKTKECKDYFTEKKPALSDVDLMVFHFFSPGQVYCAKLTEILKFKEALKFEKNGKVMYLYKTGTPSARLK